MTTAGRVVMLVLNDCRHDARVLREARALAVAGYDVTIIARTVDPYAAGADTEDRDGFRIVRVPVADGPLRWLLLARRPSALMAAARASTVAAVRRGAAGWLRLAVTGIAAAVLGIVLLLPGLALAAALLVARALARRPWFRPRWLELEWRLQWRLGTQPWTARAVAAAPKADVVHAHDFRALPGARRIRARDGAAMVYDSHEIFTEAGANATRPARARAAMLQLERRLSSEADAVVTVNDDVAAVLDERLGLGDRTVVVRNTLPRRDPTPAERAILREACGLDGSVRLLLSHGTLVPHRGFEQVAAALALPDLAGVHAAFLGMGVLRPALDAIAADPALGGRLHVLDAVPPDELPAWVAGASVAVMPIEPSTLNHRLSTPNKLFEALAVGVPIVGSDFPPMRRILLDDPDGPLGEVCDPGDPASIAAAVRRILDLSPDAAEQLRERCLRAAHARHNWEVDSARLVALYARLMAERPASRPSSPDTAQVAT